MGKLHEGTVCKPLFRRTLQGRSATASFEVSKDTKSYWDTSPGESISTQSPLLLPQIQQIYPVLLLGDILNARWATMPSILITLLGNLSWIQPTGLKCLQKNLCSWELLTTPIVGKPPWPRDPSPFKKGASGTECPT